MKKNALKDNRTELLRFLCLRGSCTPRGNKRSGGRRICGVAPQPEPAAPLTDVTQNCSLEAETFIFLEGSKSSDEVR